MTTLMAGSETGIKKKSSSIALEGHTATCVYPSPMTAIFLAAIVNQKIKPAKIKEG